MVCLRKFHLKNKINRFNWIETIDLQLRNQNGAAIEISKNDQKSLTTAMILHQKAKLMIKSKAYLKALILLAEADTEFKLVSTILK